MEGGRLAAIEVDGLMLGDHWGLMTTSIQTTLIVQKCYPRLNHALGTRSQMFERCVRNVTTCMISWFDLGLPSKGCFTLSRLMQWPEIDRSNSPNTVQIKSVR